MTSRVITWRRTPLAYHRGYTVDGFHVADVADDPPRSWQIPGWFVYKDGVAVGLPDANLARGPENGEAGKRAVEDFYKGVLG